MSDISHWMHTSSQSEDTALLSKLDLILSEVGPLAQLGVFGVGLIRVVTQRTNALESD